jgi:hypothetical protein
LAYLGRQPVVGNFVKLDAITTSATATYNLLNGGVAYFPQTANNCIVSLNGVIQSPTSAYTISGSTIVFSDALTASDSIDFILVLGDVLSIGTPSDGTVTPAKLASGLSGLISWQSVQTTGFTASAGRGYPCNTTSAGFTVTLPATPSAGDEVIVLDYAGTFDTNALVISPNGGKIEGGTSNLRLSGEREGVRLVYIDATQGWLAYSGINEGTDALSPTNYSVDFLVIAGGGGGGNEADGFASGGGGAGGYRNSYASESSGGGGSTETDITFNIGTVYTITVGAGGAVSSNGVDSSISGTGLSTITSTGGGGGKGNANGNSGGSGGGGGEGSRTGGSGTANQGFAGGNGTAGSPYTGGGGGGASAVGVTSNGSTRASGGAGLASSITGSSVSRGGGGGASSTLGSLVGNGGTGGGGAGTVASSNNAVAGTANTGGGGGGGFGRVGDPAKAGGSGVVILRMPTANYSGTTTGSPTVTTSGSDTVIVFNSSGSITG